MTLTSYLDWLLDEGFIGSPERTALEVFAGNLIDHTEANSFAIFQNVLWDQGLFGKILFTIPQSVTIFTVCDADSALYNQYSPVDYDQESSNSVLIDPIYLSLIFFTGQFPEEIVASYFYIADGEEYEADYSDGTGLWYPVGESTQPLPTPTGLTVQNVTSSSARVGWNSVSNASGYKVEYRQTGGGGLLSKNSAISLEGRAC